MGEDLNYRHKSQACTISSSVTPEFTLDQSAATCAIYCISTSSLTFTVSGTIDGTNWVNIPSWDEVGAPVGAGVSHTASTSKIIYCATVGFTKLRCVRTAGSGTIAFASSLASLSGSQISGSGAATATQTAFASAARAVAQAYQSGDLDWTGAKAIRVNVVITAVTATPSLVVRVLGLEPISGVYNYVTAAPSALTTTGHYVYVVGAGMVTTGGHIQQTTASMVPKTGAIEITHGDTDSATYSVSVEVLY